MNTVEKLELVSRYAIKLKRLVVVLILVAAAGITIDVYRKRNTTATPQLVPVTKEFTAESRGLQFRFRYPADWEIVPTAAPGATLSILLVPPNQEPGTRIEFALVDGENATKLIGNLPLIQPDATTTVNEVRDVSGHKLYRTEWYGDRKNEPWCRHCACLEGAIGDRFVSLRCFTSAPEGEVAEATKRFENWRELFDAILGTVRIETGR